MSALQIVLLVTGLLLLTAVVAGLTMVWIRHRSRRLQHRLLEECRAQGEQVVLGPQAGLYRGAARGFGNLKGNGVLCLTERRLVFTKLAGRQLEIEREQLKDATLERDFRGEAVLGSGVSHHLVVHTRDDNRIGFLVQRPERWQEAIRRLARRRAPFR